MATDRTTLPTGQGSARFEGAGEPSRAEIQQRVSALYDRAESDTGTFNATRAMRNGNRRTVTSVAAGGRPGGDPSLEAIARQWFDLARDRLGPTTPAALPADRLPSRPAPPARPQAPAGSDAVRELEASGVRLALEAGGRQAPGPAVPAATTLPALPAPRREEPRALPPAPASSGAPAVPPAGARPVAPADGLTATGNGPTAAADAFTTTGDGGLPVTASGFAVPQPALPAPVSRFPEPETGLLAASYGLLGTDAGPRTPDAPLPTPDSTAPAPQLPWPAADTTAPAPTPTTTASAPVPAPLPAYAAAPAPVPAYAPAPVTPAAPVPTGVTAYASGPAYLGKGDKALAFARAQIGRPCVWGATGPESYDCSSLTQAAWKAAGVTLPRAAVDQARAFTRVGLDDLRPGDLVFFFDDLSHTGLCTGEGTMIHAPGPGSYLREESVHGLGGGALRGAVRPA
ncbi:NlpC/P60 family protein [Streptomyces sp. NPDC088812]|uniref:C40 family peptidase n=1 Tax=Streptomyces sp. NPDC088812 TaxID=3365905 RepID=UPI003824A1CA